MQTNIQKTILQTKIGQEANDILRSCVHCGFCTATCPTYQLLGDELDGPRGRIYLIKRVLETNEATQETQTHLDRCLSCGACETTCPSGVKYRRLLDIGREIVEEKIGRSGKDSFIRKALLNALNNKKLFTFLIRSAQSIRPLLPQTLKNKVPKKEDIPFQEKTNHPRKMILFRGCVHDAIAPEINASAIRVLDNLGISVLEIDQLSCCGAVSHHLLNKNKTDATIKHNIDLLHAQLTSDVEAVFTTASACSLMLKDYPTLMSDDEKYHKKALEIVDKIKDISEIVCAESFNKITFNTNNEVVAFHSPCTLQHGLKVLNSIEDLLNQAGYKTVEVNDSHLCCGSAGTYSILQSELSGQLLSNKINNLIEKQPNIIATANIGCLSHLQSGSSTPVKHWISLINQSIN